MSDKKTKGVGDLLEEFCTKNEVKVGGNFLHFLVEAGKVAASLHEREERVIESVSAVIGKKGVNPMFICPNCDSNVLVEYGSCPVCGTELVEGANAPVIPNKIENKIVEKQIKDKAEVIREKISEKPKLVIPPSVEDIKKMKISELVFVAKSFDIEFDVSAKLPDVRKAIIDELHGQDKVTIKDIKKKQEIILESVDEDEEIEDEEIADDEFEVDDEEEVEEKPVKKTGKAPAKKVSKEVEEELDDEDDDGEEDIVPIKKSTKKVVEPVDEEIEDTEDYDDESDSEDDEDYIDEEDDEKPVKKSSKKIVTDDIEDEEVVDEEEETEDYEDDENEEEEEAIEEEEEIEEPKSLDDAKANREKVKLRLRSKIVDFKANPKLVDKTERKDLMVISSMLGIKENVQKLDNKALAQKVKDALKAKK